ncbi:unnamed protein product [Amoebophrya sp. A25]|nr:unnamed protein product [Amoebophrya sp. A25]|eukprot:GSA25T00013594001.1
MISHFSKYSFFTTLNPASRIQQAIHRETMVIIGLRSCVAFFLSFASCSGGATVEKTSERPTRVHDQVPCGEDPATADAECEFFGYAKEFASDIFSSSDSSGSRLPSAVGGGWTSQVEALVDGFSEQQAASGDDAGRAASWSRPEEVATHGSEALRSLLSRIVKPGLLDSSAPLSGTLSAALRLLSLFHTKVGNALSHALLVQSGALPASVLPTVRTPTTAGENATTDKSYAPSFASERERGLFLAGCEHADVLERSRAFARAKQTHFAALLQSPIMQMVFAKMRKIQTVELQIEQRFEYTGTNLNRQSDYWITSLPGMHEPALSGHPLLKQLRKIGPLLSHQNEEHGTDIPSYELETQAQPATVEIMHAGRTSGLAGCHAAGPAAKFCELLAPEVKSSQADQGLAFAEEATTFVFEPTKLQHFQRGRWTELRRCSSNAGLLILYNGGNYTMEVVVQDAGTETKVRPQRAVLLDTCRHRPAVTVAEDSPALLIPIWHPMVPPLERRRLAAPLLRERMPEKQAHETGDRILDAGDKNWASLVRDHWRRAEAAHIPTVFFDPNKRNSKKPPRQDL